MHQPPELLYLLTDDPVDFAEAVSGMQPVDLAEALRELRVDAAAQIVVALPFEVAVQVLDQPELDGRWTIVQAIDPARAAPLVEAMSDDQRTDLFRALPLEARDRLLPRLHPKAQEALRLLLAYPPESAGGIMTTEFLAVPASWSADAALELVQRVGASKETIYAIYVLASGTDRLQHVVSLRELVLSPRSTLMAEVGHRRAPVTVGPMTDREEVARLISKYDLLAVPVVDAGQRMLGIVTVDDVIDAIVAEQTEDAQKAGGMEALDEPYMEIGLGRMLKKRGGWLAALFLGEMLTATAMGYFEHEIERAVVLALFVPLIISSGGNSGSQATSLVIRAMALREVQLKDWWRVAVRELPSGLSLGAFLGVIGAFRILLWQWLGWYDYGAHHVLVAATVGTALLGVVTFGSLAGSMLPFLIRRLGFDPASASAPFVATLVDVTGLIIYFTVALVMLRGTIL